MTENWWIFNHTDTTFDWHFCLEILAQTNNEKDVDKITVGEDKPINRESVLTTKCDRMQKHDGK